MSAFSFLKVFRAAASTVGDATESAVSYLSDLSHELHQASERQTSSLPGFFQRVTGVTSPAVLSTLASFSAAVRSPLRSGVSALMSVSASGLPLRSDSLRNAFQNLSLTEMNVPRHHTHPVAAADRSAASITAERFAASVGLQPYFISMSASDVRNSRQGSRDYYWTKDLGVAPVPLALPTNPLAVMIDVDQYVDMPSFLLEHHVPVLIYTFQPEVVARVASNHSFTFNKLNQVLYYVVGGGTYIHQVWNYSVDHLSVSWYFLGVCFKYVSYLVDRRSTSDDHQLILLSPTGLWRGPMATIPYWWLQSGKLDRLSVATNDGFLRMQVNTPKGMFISTGKCEQFSSSLVPITVDETIATIARTSKYDLTMPQVLAFTDGDRVKAAPLLEYHLIATPHPKPSIVFPVETGVRRYQFDPFRYEPGAKPSLVAFMSPLVHGAFAPDRTVANEEQCVTGRVENVRPPELPIKDFLARVMLEFSQHLVPYVHILDPLDIDDVLDRQNRPSQRRILANAETVLPIRVIKMFMKAEAYDNVKDPRAISQINGPDKRDYSRYLYAFTDILKAQPWYAFSKPPVDIARRVAEVLNGAQIATNTDFSRFDGHGSNVMRELEKMILLRAFRPQYHDELMQLHKSQYGMVAYATFGTVYHQGFSRGSGSPETSAFNSLMNAFVAYLCLRMSKIDGVHYTPSRAWKCLGVYGGDDGLTADVDPKTYERAARMVGQELTISLVRCGSLGIKFLARVYSPNVWFGDINSCCDLPRQLSKLHTTVAMHPTITPSMKLLEKVRSFSLTDYNTPIIGEICWSVVKAHGSDIKFNPDLQPMASWLSNIPLDAQYPNELGDWLDDYCESALPEFDVARFREWLVNCRTVEDHLTPPLCQEPVLAKPKVPAVVDGDVHPLGIPLLPMPPREDPSITIARAKSEHKKEVKDVPKDDRAAPSKKQRDDHATRLAKFEATKARKKALGTWTEAPPKRKEGARK